MQSPRANSVGDEPATQIGVSLRATGAISAGNDQEQRFIFTAPLIDPDVINRAINVHASDDEEPLTGSHLVKGISGANSDCWWRAGWLSVLIQYADKRTPAKQLEQHLINKLGVDYTAEAKSITKMITSIRKRGFQSVLTHTKGANRTDFTEVESRLKLPREKNTKDKTKAEDVCRRLTEALLRMAGVPDGTLTRSLHTREPGDESLTSMLSHELACDMVLFSKPWTVTDHVAPALWVCPQINSPLNTLDANVSNPNLLTAELLKKIRQIPVVITQGSHFNLAIPTRLVPWGYDHN